MADNVVEQGTGTPVDQERPYRIGISGSYGGLNLGDEAILQCMVTQLRMSLPAEITVFSRDPADTLARHRVEHAVPVRRMTRDEARRVIGGLDLLILGGGGILYDADARTYLREPILAQELGVPVMVYAVSAGPLRDSGIQQIVRESLNDATYITVRDRNARRVLEDIGVYRQILVTADPALLMEPEPIDEAVLARERIDRSDRLVGLSVREHNAAAPDLDEGLYHTLLANVADFIIERFDADVLFMPMERQVLDVQLSHAVIARMLRPQRATVLEGAYSSGQMLTMMGRLTFAVGMRLHFLVFAAIAGIPFVALPYSPKVGGFLEDIGLEMPPIHLVNAGRLIAYVDEAWDNRETVRRRVREALPNLRKRARLNNEIAVEILREQRQRRHLVDDGVVAK